MESQEYDLLGTFEAAARLAELIDYSRRNTPFVLAIDGRWGSGKSTLMRQLSRALHAHNDIEVVWFNAWTASGANALTGILKIVLGRLDANVVRRTVRGLNSGGVLTSTVRLGLTLTAGIFRADRTIDRLWERMSVDAKAREEVRLLLQTAVKSWVDRGTGVPMRTLAVFVDDLDRCSEQTVVEVCEVIKLYLDLPGLVFVLGCDLGVLSRLPMPATNTSAHVRNYLEKIVQVSYQIPIPAALQIQRMVEGYAESSRTASLLTVSSIALIGRQSGGNPRRVKRLLNSFVAEYHLDPGWRELGSEALMNAVILQHFYPELYQEILREDSDTVGGFVDYRHARDWLRHSHSGNMEDAERARSVLKTYGISASPDVDDDARNRYVSQLDDRVADVWRSLSGSDDCLALLRGFGDTYQRLNLQQRLRRRPLTTTPNPVRDVASEQSRLDGLRLLWVDDNPANNESMIHSLIARGAQVRTATSGPQAISLLPYLRPSVVLSDVTRYGQEVGFDDLSAMRTAGFAGSCLFFTAVVTPTLRAKAEAVGAAGITASPDEVVNWIDAVARRLMP